MAQKIMTMNKCLNQKEAKGNAGFPLMKMGV